MLDFNTACEMARENLVKQEYKNGINGIYDLGDKWLFFGRMFDIGVPDYGNTPITIDKNTGRLLIIHCQILIILIGIMKLKKSEYRKNLK